MYAYSVPPCKCKLLLVTSTLLKIVVSVGQHQHEYHQTTDFAQGEEFTNKECLSDSEVESVVEEEDGTDNLDEVELEDDESEYKTETGTETDEESGDKSSW